MAHTLDAILQRALAGISQHPQERRNLFWLTTACLLSGAAATLCGGDLWTGFLKQTGFTMTQMGVMSSAGGFAAAFALIAFMGLADRIQRRIRVYAICILVSAVGPVIIVAAALAPRTALPLSAMLAIFLGLGVGQALVMAIPTMLDYPVMARAASVEIRGRLFGMTTTAYGVLGIGLGWLSAHALKSVAYPMGYVWCFLAGAAAIALRAAAFSRVRELPELAVAGASRSVLPLAALVDVMRLKEFRWLAGPHVARGLATSVAGFALPVGLQHLGLPKYFPGYASSVTTAATVLGGIVVGLYADRLGAAWATLWGDVLYALGMATVMLSPSPATFLLLYLVMHFGRNIEDNAVPLGAINIVPAEHLGAFSAARLMILIASGAVGAPIFGYLFDHCNPALVFGLAACLKLLTGVWFWWVLRLKPPMRPPAVAAA